MLNVQQYEYASLLTEYSGARILLHDRNVMPFPESSGINVEPNTYVELAVTEVRSQKAT